MAGRISIVVKKNRLPAIARTLPEAAGVIVKRNGEAAVDRAKALVPVDTSRLQQTIRFEMTGQTTGHLTAGGMEIDDVFVDYELFVHNGSVHQSATPFLAQAAADQKSDFERDFKSLERMLA